MTTPDRRIAGITIDTATNSSSNTPEAVMTGRTIAEIIGWRRNPDFQSHNSEDEWITADREDDGERRTADRVEVDDLLAWLRSGTYFLGEVMWHNDWGIHFINTDSGLDGEWFNGPTLLAALENAVRAADKETS